MYIYKCTTYYLLCLLNCCIKAIHTCTNCNYICSRSKNGRPYAFAHRVVNVKIRGSKSFDCLQSFFVALAEDERFLIQDVIFFH